MSDGTKVNEGVEGTKHNEGVEGTKHGTTGNK